MSNLLSCPIRWRWRAIILWTWLALIGASVGALVVAIRAYRRDREGAILDGPLARMPRPMPASPNSGPDVGERAPDFELINVRTGKPVRLSAYHGRPVLLFFGTYS